MKNRQRTFLYLRSAEANEYVFALMYRSPADGPQFIIVMGVAGVGKTTVGRLLAERLGWTFLDADDFHPSANVSKMQSGAPLTDADREGWLERLHALVGSQLNSGERTVLACSALKSTYRSKLTKGHDGVVFVYLRAPRRLVEDRLVARTGHFFDAGLLASQFAALEEPEDAIVVDAVAPADVIVDSIAAHIEDQ